MKRSLSSLEFALFLFICLAIVGGQLKQAVAAPSKRPNVVLVITDDQGYGDIAAHGNEMIQTPNLDALAKASIRLTNFHVDPTCAETRSALMTGRYASRVGVWHTIMGRSLLRADETTMADLFSAAGYQTGIFGKWHLGDNYPFRPQDRGFGEVLICGGGGVGQTPDFWNNDYFDDTYFHNGQPEKQNGYCTDVFFSAGMKFIEENRERPFFCYIPTNAPHGPFFVEKKYSQPYVEKGVPQPMANFYGMIENIDDNMQRLTAKLKQLGLEKNTLLIFMTDNGTAAGVARRKTKPGAWRGFNNGMRGQKGSQYEGGHRVPCYIRWPAGELGQPREIDTLAAQFDLLPTLADFCGLRRSDDKPLDGRSLRPLLEGNSGWKKRTLFVHSQRLDQPEKWRKCSVMTERWRLVDGRELYDIRTDSGQQKNVAADHAQVVIRLRGRYEKWWSGVSTRFGEYCESILGAAEANPTTLTCHDWHAEISQVPWNHNLIKRDPPSNGFWAVEISQAGQYEFTLGARPQGVSFPLKSGKARIQIGEISKTKPITAGAESVVFKLDLPAGKVKLKTTLTQQGQGSRGAFFVTVRRLQ